MTLSNSIWSSAEIEGSIDYDRNIEDIMKKNAWHTLFESPKWILLNPADEVIQFYTKYIENPSRQQRERTHLAGKKIHDLGCGGGRHIYYFAELGFDVTGSDLSTNAIDFTKKELQRRQIDAVLTVCPMTELPFQDGEFDVTISRAAINHAPLQDIKKVVYEIARTTKKGGLLFVTVSSDRASDFRRGTEVVKDLTYIPPDGPEKGLIHTFFSATNAAALFEPFFRIDEIYLAEHPPLLPSAPGATDANEYFGSEYVIIGVRR